MIEQLNVLSMSESNEEFIRIGLQNAKDPRVTEAEEPSNFKVILTPTEEVVEDDFTLSEYIEAHVENSILDIDLEALIELRVDQRMEEIRERQNEMYYHEYELEELFEEYQEFEQIDGDNHAE